MLRSVLVSPGNISIEEVTTPTPGPGELLVEVAAALTCGTDLKAYMRGHPLIPMPGPFGHEFSGVVAARGKGVRGFKEGDPVMSVHSAPCLRCPYCRKGLQNLCENIMETKALGAFADYMLLPAHVVRQNAYPKPKGLGFEEAALLEPLACVVHGVEPLGVRRGETALVLGAGPIGLLHAMLLKSKGARVAVADIRAARLESARTAGADEAVDASRKDLKKTAADFTPGGIGFDYVFECTGRQEVWERSVDYLRRGGTAVLFGGCPPGTRVAYDAHRLHYDEITLKGDFHYTPKDVETAHGLLARKRLKTSLLISGSFPLIRIHEAFHLLAEGKGIKYAIVP